MKKIANENIGNAIPETTKINRTPKINQSRRV